MNVLMSYSLGLAVPPVAITTTDFQAQRCSIETLQPAHLMYEWPKWLTTWSELVEDFREWNNRGRKYCLNYNSSTNRRISMTCSFYKICPTGKQTNYVNVSARMLQWALLTLSKIFIWNLLPYCGNIQSLESAKVNQSSASDCLIPCGSRKFGQIFYN